MSCCCWRRMACGTLCPTRCVPRFTVSAAFSCAQHPKLLQRVHVHNHLTACLLHLTSCVTAICAGSVLSGAAVPPAGAAARRLPPHRRQGCRQCADACSHRPGLLRQCHRRRGRPVQVRCLPASYNCWVGVCLLRRSPRTSVLGQHFITYQSSPGRPSR
jgi:hypothetical protein